MTTIEKLLIKGIRSFSPATDSVITFYKPLTLIVGQNGAGKTTIIECLKYACTGETPPNAGKSGQGFVHDPKVAGEREVRAQVKLRFVTLTGKPFLVMRSMQLTQKASKQEFKTLEAHVETYNAEGKKTSHTQRCIDVDRFVPEAMGVSKPVLESVIFCHQEEANWPLMEGAKIKQRFDEIFAATRYTKALDAVKKLKKEHVASARELKLKLETAAAHKTQADKLRKSLSDHEKAIAAHEKKVGEFAAEMPGKEERVRSLRERRTAISTAAAKVAVLRGRRDQLKQTSALMTRELHGHEYEGTDAELQQATRKLQQELQGTESDTSGLARRQKELEAQRKSLQQRDQQIAVDLAKLLAEEKQLEDLRGMRAKLLRAFSVKFKLGTQPSSQDSPAASSAQSDDWASSVIGRAQEMLAAIDAKIRETKASGASLLAESDAAIAQLAKEHNLNQERISQRRTETESISKKIASLRAELSSKLASKKEASSTLEDVPVEEERLEQLRAEHDAAHTEEQIAEAIARKKRVDAELVELSEAMKRLGMQADARAKLDISREAKSRCEKALEACLSKPELAGHSIADDFEAAVRAAEAGLAKAKADAEAASKEREEEQGKASELSGRAATARETLARMEADVEDRRRRLSAVCDEAKEFPDVVKEVEAALSKMKRDLTVTTSTEDLYRRFISLAHESKSCPLCERSFPSEPEFASFVQKLGELVTAIPTAASASSKRRDVEATEARLSKLHELRPAWEDSRRLAAELPNAQSAEASAASQAKAAAESAATLARASEAAMAGVSRAQSALAAAREAREHAGRLRTACSELTAAEERLARESVDKRSLEDVRREFDGKQREAAELSGRVDGLREAAARSAREIAAQEKKVQAFRESAGTLRAVEAEIARVEAGIAEADARVEVLRRELEALHAKAPEVESALRSARQQRAETAAQCSAAEDQLRRERDALQESLSRAQSSHENVVRASRESAGAGARREELGRQRSQVAEELERVAKDLLGISKRLEGAKDAQAQRELALKFLQDNARLREVIREQRSAEDELRREQERAGVAAEEVTAVDRDLASAEEELTAVRRGMDRSAGARDEVEAQAKRERTELLRPQMVNADEDYRVNLIALETTELAGADLDRYFRALDAALMRYHAAKMEDINRLVRELWQATYRSSDIDAIEIRSDVTTEEGGAAAAASSAATTARNYHYRVVMLKGGIELDMRGRCSAGQKVLASLVIRLALAETFCLNCGILALDEPTTNLDRHNVESFANALVSLINTRRAQRGFQLIVITHDEEFVQLLGRGEFADYYWRVSKDEKQHSMIERHDIRDLA